MYFFRLWGNTLSWNDKFYGKEVSKQLIERCFPPLWACDRLHRVQGFSPKGDYH